ncbi:MAG: BPL-N domain-containing protein [Candidatus Thorarchaeota archaeon]
MTSRRNMTKRTLLSMLMVLLISTMTSFSQVEASALNDLGEVKVAVYDGGAGVSSEPRESSAAALFWMFRWMNATVEMVNSSAIKQGILDDFQIIAVPGGYAYDYYLDLGYSGANAIRDFVAGGGSYWGSCAGAFYALEEFEWSEYGETGTYYYGLGLFPGRGVGPIVGIADWPNIAMTDVQINTTNGLIDFSEEPSNHSIMYWGGPYFETEGIAGITTLATYSYNDMPAMIAFEYMNGSVFLTGPHPEWEEDSFRDGSISDNYLEENGSEWELCKKVAMWLAYSDGMSTNPSPESYLIIMMASIGIIAIAALIVRLGRR